MERDEYQSRWNTFVERVNDALHATFEEDDRAVVVLGIQFGEMGTAEAPDLPACLVTSNLPICAIPTAIASMGEQVDIDHARYHGQEVEPSDPSRVQALIEQALGLDPGALDGARIEQLPSEPDTLAEVPD